MKNLLVFLTLLLLSAVPTIAHADSILVGTDLSNLSSGPVLCPQASNCSIRLSQFILVDPVVIHTYKIALSGYSPLLSQPNGSFTVDFPGLQYSGTVGFLQDQPLTEVFEFTDLNIAFSPGIYYIQATGVDVIWDTAPPLMTSAGSLGLQLSCDPFQTCGADLSRYDVHPGPYAIEIDGTVVTPEPSTFILLGTGFMGVIARMRRRLRGSHNPKHNP